ncbi:MAG: FAD-dependent oxidoreductase [Opitutae bacterium]|nr:FAD-dependent oxidoreductase [Opitutae bacterium]
MQKSLLGASAFAGLSVASTAHAKVESPQKSLEPEVTNEVDVLVVGSGSAGTTAAIQAGRAGAKTLLMERNSQLGGTTTTGGVAYPGLFDAWGKQVISGIGWELVKESVELDGGKFPDFSKVPRAHHHNQIHIMLTVRVVPRWLAYLDLNVFVGRRGNRDRIFSRLALLTILHQANSTVFMYTEPTPRILELSPWPT